MTAPRFCSEHSSAAGEPLAGWGAHQVRNILIRWPKSGWRHSLRIAGGMPDQLQAAIARVVGAGWRVNLIDRKPYDSDLIRVFLMPEALVFDLEPGELAPFLDAVANHALLKGYHPKPLALPLILCCTHGKHDRCCAKWGFAVYKTLAAEARKTGGFDVWECTHLGGCRLSASVLTMPAMRKYGRLAPADAASFLAAEAEDRPYVPRYRGASHLSPVQQVAEVTALKAIRPSGLHGPAQILEVGASENERHFIVELTGHRARVICRRETVRAYGSCEDLDAALPLDPKEIWRGDFIAIIKDTETNS